jgi:hypothetical protein
MDVAKKCNLCFQQFATQSALKAHSPLCNLAYQTKRERKRAIIKDEEEEQDETLNIPYKELVFLVRELAAKNDKLEKKVAGLEKWVNTKKKRVNVEEWLTKHVVPAQSWSPWAKAHFEFNDDDLDDFVTGNVFPVTLVENILTQGLNNGDYEAMPIQAFAHKLNELYIYTKNKEKELVWRRLDATDFKRLLMHIQKLISNRVMGWINDTNNLEQKQMNKIVQHLAEIPSDANHAAFSRFMRMTYQCVKQEFRSVIEIEI